MRFILSTTSLANLVSHVSTDPAYAVAIARLIFNLSVAMLALPLVKPIARWAYP